MTRNINFDKFACSGDDVYVQVCIILEQHCMEIIL